MCKKIRKIQNIFDIENLPCLPTFTQPTKRLKNFLMSGLLILGLKESVVECATMWVKSEVILDYLFTVLSIIIPEKKYL